MRRPLTPNAGEAVSISGKGTDWLLFQAVRWQEMIDLARRWKPAAVDAIDLRMFDGLYDVGVNNK